MAPQVRQGRAALELTAMALLIVLAMPAAASGVRRSDKAQPGEIVLIRNVSARPAVRMHPPGMALLMDPSPRKEIDHALGEMSDDDYREATSGSAVVEAGIAGRIGNGRGEGALGAITGTLVRTDGPMPAGRLAGTIGGAVGTATRGMDANVRGALAQFPGMGGK